MSIASKIFNKLVFRALLALSIGVGFSACVALMLALYGLNSTPEAPLLSRATTIETLPFPENEHDLNALSNRLKKDGAALELAHTEPGAGE